MRRLLRNDSECRVQLLWSDQPNIAIQLSRALGVFSFGLDVSRKDFLVPTPPEEGNDALAVGIPRDGMRELREPS